MGRNFSRGDSNLRVQGRRKHTPPITGGKETASQPMVLIAHFPEFWFDFPGKQGSHDDDWLIMAPWVVGSWGWLETPECIDLLQPQLW